MNVLLLIFGLICSANGFKFVPLPTKILFRGPEDTDTIQDGGKFFSFSGAVLPNESSSEPQLTPTTANLPTTPESAVTTTSSTETVFLVPLSDTIFFPDYMISSASFYAAAAPFQDYPNPPTDTQLPSNLELAEITDTIRADPIADYVQNYPLANNLQQHYPITKEQMLLTQLYDMDFVNKTEIKPATSINNFHVNQLQRQQKSQQHLTKRSEYQQPFENVNISSNSSTSNINATNSSVDEKYILTNETDAQVGNPESAADVETTTGNAEEDFSVNLYSTTFDFFEKANTTIVEEFLDENGRPCIAEQLMFYSKAYFRYTCEGELFQEGVVDKARPTLSNSEDDAISAAQMNSSSLPPDLHNFHSFYLKRRAN